MTNERAQYEADQLHISELEEANKALQAKITEQAALILDYEQKWDVIAEGEGKRMLEFGEYIKQLAMQKSSHPNYGKRKAAINDIDLKRAYNKFKKK